MNLLKPLNTSRFTMIYKRNTVGGNMAYLILKEMIIENFKNIDKKTITFDYQNNIFYI